MEGHGTMTGIYDVHWTVEPATPPEPWRHCSGCGDLRPFLSSGKIRLNANGRKLDAWLIYRCAACDRTWNRPIAERQPVASIAQADLWAMQMSEASWVRAREFDTAALGRSCSRIELSPEVSVVKTVLNIPAGPWSVIQLVIDAPRPTGQRLDRLLAAELNLSRSALSALHRTGGLSVEPAARTGLKKPVAGRLAVQFTASRLMVEHGSPLRGFGFG